MIHTHICLHVTTTYAERNFSSIRKLLKKIQVRVCVCVFSINARVLISFCSNGWVLRIKNGKGFFVLLGRCSWWAGLAQRFESWAAAQDWRWAGQERQGRAHAEVPGEGCKVDLSDAKAYYSRHRICGVHSKSPKVIVAGIEQRFCQQCSRFHQLAEFDQGKRSCRIHLAGHNERRRKPPQECKNLRPSFIDNNHISKSGGFAMDFSPYPSFLTRRELSPDSASERGLTTNRAAITGKYEFPWQSNSPQNPLSDLLTCRPSYSASPVASSQECFNGVSDSSNALSLLSNNPWAGPKSRLGVNGQPSYDNPGSAIGDFVCSPWNFKGNGDVGLGEASQPGNGGLELGQQNVVHFGQLDQTREFQI